MLLQSLKQKTMNKFLLLCLAVLFNLLSYAAWKTPSKPDSSLRLSSSYQELSSKTKVLVERELKNSREEFIAHQVVLKQNRTFVLLKNELAGARNFLKQGYSYQEIKKETDRLSEWKALAGAGVITSKDNIPTVRNLTTTSILLKELLKRTDIRLQEILAYHRSLGHFQYNLDSLMMDSVLYQVPNDSVALMRYFQRLIVIGKDIKPVVEPLKAAIDSIEKLEIKVNLIKFSLESDIAETETQRKELFEKVGLIESGTFGTGKSNELPFREALSYSLGKANLVLFFYLVNHFSAIILMILFIIGAGTYLSMLKRRSRETPVPELLRERLQVLTYPFASATLLVITAFQFFLPLPPFIFSGCLWIISGIALSVILHKSVTPWLFRIWLIFFILYLFVFTDNLMLRQSMVERWTILVLSVAGLSTGVYFLAGMKRHGVSDKLILVFLGLMALFETLAITNFFSGGYNQIKTFMASGYFTIIVACLMYWTARLANDTLKISYHIHKGEDDDHQNLKNKKTPFYLYLLFFAGCFILITRNFYFYQTMFEPLSSALTEPREIGAFTFTLKSISIFTLVLFLSGIITRIVSFLAADAPASPGKPKSGGLGSWLLLIRIAIITAGVLLAFVSAGIPMDKFAIILGALSVGIGFGMQTLVNNLVSGLFIAFEKPVNVGDIVDIAGRTGKMKSIGIRSSVITTWDGADVIVPNGDLLNQHLVNWTLGSSRRRFDLPLGVAYGTDLAKAKQLLLDLMLADPRILKHPEPFVQANEFNSSAIDLVMKFWVPHFSIGFDVKSDLILAIDALFREQGIQIPFPQQDVHIIPE